jgi:hypothetical protein
MTQLLPVALRGILPENVRLAIVKVCAFLNAISQKVIDMDMPFGYPRISIPGPAHYGDGLAQGLED